MYRLFLHVQMSHMIFIKISAFLLFFSVYLYSILSLSCDELKLKKTSNFCLYKDTEDLSNLPFDVPNAEEIKRSVAVASASYWGMELKKRRSLRVRELIVLELLRKLGLRMIIFMLTIYSCCALDLRTLVDGTHYFYKEE